MTTNILFIEDDPTTCRVIAKVLETAGYQVTATTSGNSALRMLSTKGEEAILYDIVIADIFLGERIDGLEILHCAKSLQVPPMVILLTGYGTLETAVEALRGGAFDYLLKPCDPQDIVACVERALKQRLTVIQENTEKLVILPNSPLQFGLLSIDHVQQRIFYDGQDIRATPIEYALIQLLAEIPGKVYNYCDIVRHTHGYDVDDIEAMSLLKQHIHNLRRKLDPSYLVNIRGVGYKLDIS